MAKKGISIWSAQPSPNQEIKIELSKQKIYSLKLSDNKMHLDKST